MAVALEVRELLAALSPARVGELVAAARLRAGFSEVDLAFAIGVPVRTVQRWESGEAKLTDAGLLAVAAALGCGVRDIVPPRDPVSFDASSREIRVGDQRVVLDEIVADNDAVLGAYVGLLRKARHVEAGAPLRLRSDDISVLAEVLDLDDSELVDRLVRHVVCTHEEAGDVKRRVARRHRLAASIAVQMGLMSAMSVLPVAVLPRRPTDDEGADDAPCNEPRVAGHLTLIDGTPSAMLVAPSPSSELSDEDPDPEPPRPVPVLLA